MTHLIDSDLLIDAVERRPAALTVLDLIGLASMSMSVVSIGEFLGGIVLELDYERRREEFDQLLSPFQFHNVDSDIMARFASIRADLHRRGRMIPDFDIVIASTAIVRYLILLTRNRKHFERISDLRFLTPDDVLKG